MTDPVITDDEKDALLDGISSGEVEVHSNSGPTYAEVNDFQIGPRSMLITNSYPRLQGLNRQFANHMSKHIEQLLNAVSTVTFKSIDTCTYSDFSEQIGGLSLLLEFEPKPLQGSALISLNSDALEMLVETFYGGTGNEPARQDAEFFTPGEICVANLFCGSILSVTKETWQPLAAFEPEFVNSHLSSGVIDCIEPGDSIISCEFEFTVGDATRTFHLLWPVRTVASLLPVFEGQKRDRDAAEDARWAQSLRARVIDSTINISSGVGKARMTLREVAELAPGDVINISNPNKGTVFAQHVPILEGRFGVHDGRYAMETTRWLEPEAGSETTNSK